MLLRKYLANICLSVFAGFRSVVLCAVARLLLTFLFRERWMRYPGRSLHLVVDGLPGFGRADILSQLHEKKILQRLRPRPVCDMDVYRAMSHRGLYYLDAFSGVQSVTPETLSAQLSRLLRKLVKLRRQFHVSGVVLVITETELLGIQSSAVSSCLACLNEIRRVLPHDIVVRLLLVDAPVSSSESGLLGQHAWSAIMPQCPPLQTNLVETGARLSTTYLQACARAAFMVACADLRQSGLVKKRRDNIAQLRRTLVAMDKLAGLEKSCARGLDRMPLQTAVSFMPNLANQTLTSTTATRIIAPWLGRNMGDFLSTSVRVGSQGKIHRWGKFSGATWLTGMLVVIQLAMYVSNLNLLSEFHQASKNASQAPVQRSEQVLQSYSAVPGGSQISRAVFQLDRLYINPRLQAHGFNLVQRVIKPFDAQLDTYLERAGSADSPAVAAFLAMRLCLVELLQRGLSISPCLDNGSVNLNHLPGVEPFKVLSALSALGRSGLFEDYLRQLMLQDTQRLAGLVGVNGFHWITYLLNSGRGQGLDTEAFRYSAAGRQRLMFWWQQSGRWLESRQMHIRRALYLNTYHGQYMAWWIGQVKGQICPPLKTKNSLAEENSNDCDLQQLPDAFRQLQNRLQALLDQEPASETLIPMRNLLITLEAQHLTMQVQAGSENLSWYKQAKTKVRRWYGNLFGKTGSAATDKNNGLRIKRMAKHYSDYYYTLSRLNALLLAPELVPEAVKNTFAGTVTEAGLNVVGGERALMLLRESLPQEIPGNEAVWLFLNDLLHNAWARVLMQARVQWQHRLKVQLKKVGLAHNASNDKLWQQLSPHVLPYLESNGAVLTNKQILGKSFGFSKKVLSGIAVYLDRQLDADASYAVQVQTGSIRENAGASMPVTKAQLEFVCGEQTQSISNRNYLQNKVLVWYPERCESIQLSIEIGREVYNLSANGNEALPWLLNSFAHGQLQLSALALQGDQHYLREHHIKNIHIGFRVNLPGPLPRNVSLPELFAGELFCRSC